MLYLYSINWCDGWGGGFDKKSSEVICFDGYILRTLRCWGMVYEID